MDREFFTKTMGFTLVSLGLFIITFARKLCYIMCETCTKGETYTSLLLLLFVGIVFIVNGAILIVFYRTDNPVLI